MRVKSENGWQKAQNVKWLTLSLVLYTRNLDSQSAAVFYHS